MTPTIILIISLAALAAAFTQRVSGFGFGIFMMTLLPHYTRRLNSGNYIVDANAETVYTKIPTIHFIIR